MESRLLSPLQAGALLAICWGAVVAAQGPLTAGDVQCRCVNSSDLGPAAAAANISSGFGIGCAAHWQRNGGGNLSEWAQCKGSIAARPWCNNSWCFVNPANCSLPTSVTGDQPLYYSYQTCGHLDSVSPEAASTALQGQVLRVAYLNNTAGFTGSYYFGGWQGPTFDYWSAVLANAKVVPVVLKELRVSPWPNMSLPWPAAMMRQFRVDYPSSRSIFDSCVYAAGMGFVDLCIGAFTVNEPRVRIAQMVEYFQVNIQLVVQQSFPEQSVSDEIGSAWAPFTTGLWLMIFAVVLVAALLVVLHERISSPEPIVLRRLAHVYRCIGGMAFGVYDGWMTFWGGGRAIVDPEGLAGRLTSMGLVIFVLMAIAAYTANITSFLVKKQAAGGGINSLQDIIDNPQYKICCESQLVDSFVSKLGIPRAQVVGLGSRATILTSIRDGVCDAGGIYAEDLVQAHSRGTFCDYQKIDDLMTTGQGVPVSERVARVMQWGHKIQEKAGTWDLLSRAAEAQYTDACPPAPKQDTSGALQASAMLGPLVVSSAFFGAGIVVSFGKCLDRFARHRKHLKDGDGNGMHEENAVAFADFHKDHHHAEILEDVRARLDAMVSDF